MSMLARYERFVDKTFKDAREKYLAEFSGKALKRQQYALAHVAPYIDHLPLIDVDDDALSRFKVDRLQVAMAGTINKEIGTVTTVLNKATRVWRWIPSAPLLQRVDGKTREAYPLSWPQQIEVFSRLVGNLQKICLFIINTGLRREEVFNLKWSDERDFNGVKIFILHGDETKNGKSRPVILNSTARRVVEQMRQPTTDKHFPRSDEYVFPRMTVNKIFNKAWIAAGLPDEKLVKKGVHNLRHTFGYRLRHAGVSAEDRDSLLGHHNRSLSQHYAVPDLHRLAELAELVTVRNDMAILR